MIPLLVALPGTAGLIALLLRSDRARRILLTATAIIHAALVALCWTFPPPPTMGGWLALDPLGRLFLGVISVLFLAAAPYAASRFQRERTFHAAHPGPVYREPEAILTACLLFLLATMTLVCASQNLGLFWVAMEATTLASAPMVFHRGTPRAVEAAWKYLMLGSVGIALALLGTFFLKASAGGQAQLNLPWLLQAAPHFHPFWLRAAFLLLLVGYGTKMGMAPLHTWRPDAYSEAPSVASALLSGALVNCAFLGILRAHQVVTAAGQGSFSRDLLIGFGLISMTVAAAFLLHQKEYKRLLAYSSVEHVGILALGIGLGGVGTGGSLLHAVNHGLAKCMLFLLAGNILATYGTRDTDSVTGARRILPATGILWIAGLFAITGTPPFGTFLSELTVLRAAVDSGRFAIAAAYLLLLGIAFLALSRTILAMSQGQAPSGVQHRESPGEWAPPLALCAACLLLGVWMPPPLADLLGQAARSIGA